MVSMALQIKSNTTQKIKKVITTIKENAINDKVKILLSSVFHRDYQNKKDETLQRKRFAPYR